MGGLLLPEPAGQRDFGPSRPPRAPPAHPRRPAPRAPCPRPRAPPGRRVSSPGAACGPRERRRGPRKCVLFFRPIGLSRPPARVRALRRARIGTGVPLGVVSRGGALAGVADRGGVLWAGLFGSRFGLEVRVLALARPSINRRSRPDDTNATRAALVSALTTGVSEAQAPTPPRARERAHGAPRLRAGVRNRRFGPRAAGARGAARASRPDRTAASRRSGGHPGGPRVPSPVSRRWRRDHPPSAASFESAMPPCTTPSSTFLQLHPHPPSRPPGRRGRPKRGPRLPGGRCLVAASRCRPRPSLLWSPSNYTPMLCFSPPPPHHSPAPGLCPPPFSYLSRSQSPGCCGAQRPL